MLYDVWVPRDETFDFLLDRIRNIREGLPWIGKKFQQGKCHQHNRCHMTGCTGFKVQYKDTEMGSR